MTDMNNLPDSLCEHVLRQDGIHELTLVQFGVTGAEACMSQFERIYESRLDTSAPLRVLLNSHGGTLPLNYIIERGKRLVADYPHVGVTNIAIIIDNPVESRLADSFMRLVRFPKAHVRFFIPSRSSNAVQWLLQQTE